MPCNYELGLFCKEKKGLSMENNNSKRTLGMAAQTIKIDNIKKARYLIIVIMLTLLLIAITGCSKSASVSGEEPVRDNAKDDGFDFRKTYFGMSREDVQKSEGKPFDKEDSLFGYYLNISVSGFDADIVFGFNDSGDMNWFNYVFTDSDNAEANHAMIKESLTEIYGNPVIDNTGDYKNGDSVYAVWEAPGMIHIFFTIGAGWYGDNPEKVGPNDTIIGLNYFIT